MLTEDGLLLAAERGRLMQALPTGEMLAVSAPEGRVARHLEAWRASVSIAALNGPESVVVSGEPEAIREVRARLEADGLRCEPLRVSHAFHSPMMDPMLDALEHHAASIRHADPRLDLISNLTGDVATSGSLGASYWRRHARGAVRFEASLRTLQSRGCDILVEVGPHATLLGLARQTVDRPPSARPASRQEWDTLLDALGALFVHGVVVDWAAFHRDRPRRRLALPTYAFQRERCWVASDARLRSSRPTGTTHPFLATRMDLANAPGTHVWEGEVSIAVFPYLRDHRVQHGAVVPATAWTEMGLEAFTEAHGAGPVALEGLEYLKPLFLGEDDRNCIR
jgi:acyl transferase domain-containing protein